MIELISLSLMSTPLIQSDLFVYYSKTSLGHMSLVIVWWLLHCKDLKKTTLKATSYLIGSHQKLSFLIIKLNFPPLISKLYFYLFVILLKLMSVRHNWFQRTDNPFNISPVCFLWPFCLLKLNKHNLAIK